MTYANVDKQQQVNHIYKQILKYNPNYVNFIARGDNK